MRFQYIVFANLMLFCRYEYAMSLGTAHRRNSDLRRCDCIRFPGGISRTSKQEHAVQQLVEGGLDTVASIQRRA